MNRELFTFGEVVIALSMRMATIGWGMSAKWTHNILVLLLYSCNQSFKPEDSMTRSLQDTSSNSKTATEIGKRHSIHGNFSGVNAIDTIHESYISSLTNKETFKHYDSGDAEKNIELVIQSKPISRLYTTIAGVDTFVTSNSKQQTGLCFLENLGDLNGDYKDELGYAINWADFSNMNTYHILTIADNKFIELFSFKINEAVNLDADELIDSKYLVKRISPQTIEYKFYSDSATVETGRHKFD